MERGEQRRVVEALVLASPEPLSASRIAQIAPECTPSLARDLVGELNQIYETEERAFEIWEVAGGYQVRTRAEFSGYLQQLQKVRPMRLSRAALETLAIVAYKQPATRGEVEDVRGVDVGATIKSLMDRGLVKITGQKEVPGRPMLYGTTRRFLEVFGLESLKALPTLRELDELVREQGLADGDGSEEGEEGAEAASIEGAEATDPAAGEGAEASSDDVATGEASAFDEETADEELLEAASTPVDESEAAEAALEPEGADEPEAADLPEVAAEPEANSIEAAAEQQAAPDAEPESDLADLETDEDPEKKTAAESEQMS